MYLDYSMRSVRRFKRVELNYIEKLGRAEIKGESVLYNDLEIKLLIDEEEAKADYKSRALVKKTTKKLRMESIFICTTS
jgi:hypothetical protein